MNLTVFNEGTPGETGTRPVGSAAHSHKSDGLRKVLQILRVSRCRLPPHFGRLRCLEADVRTVACDCICEASPQPQPEQISPTSH